PSQALARWRGKEGLAGTVLPPGAQDEVLAEVAAWAAAEAFGDLDAVGESEEAYVLEGVHIQSWERRDRMGELLTEVGQALVEGSLSDEDLLARTGRPSVFHILPEANVIKVGGQSFIDRGRAAVFPFIDEVVATLGRHQMILGTGAGTRARHAYSVGLDLGMPTGVLSVLGTFVSMQN